MPFRPHIALALVAAVPVFAGTNSAIVVSASRLDALSTDVLDVASDVSVIDRECIEQSKAQSIPDLLAQEANVLFRSPNGKGDAGELAMRGFGENSGLRVLVVVDGQKMNRPDMGVFDWQQLPLSDIESIEVLRGGQSVLYGNHAVAGVVKITTRKGGAPAAEAYAATGSFGSSAFGARVSGGAGLFFGDAGAAFQRDEGYRENSLSWNKNANASVGADVGESDSIVLRASVGQSYSQYPGPLTYADYLEDPTQSSNEGDQFSETDSALATLLWEGEREWGSVQLNGGVSWRDIDWELSGTLGENEQFGYSVSPKLNFGDDDRYVGTGLDLFCDTLDFEGDRDTSFNRAQLNRITAEPFVWAQLPVSATVTLSGGARYSYARTHGENVEYDKQNLQPFITNRWGIVVENPDYTTDPVAGSSFDENVEKQGWVGAFSVVWRPVESISLWGGYDMVYRYPALDEVISYQGYALADPFNEKLEAETGHNFEVGGKWQSNAWRSSATLFFLMMDDEIAYDSVEEQNTNIGSTRRVGADLELAYAKKHYGASALASFVRATFDGGANDGQWVPLVPDANTRLALWVEPLAWVRVTAAYAWVASRFQGGDYANDDRELPAYGRVALQADFSVGDRVTAYAKVENLLDKDYIDSAYGGGYYPGSGRAFFGGVKVEF
ncbi:TonB-dependent receptor [Pontiella sp.]|uniref:TonB-dependent receptor n=1 Tax=Pontiella sp. TaxID=2837462 RepID=UPI00356204E7